MSLNTVKILGVKINSSCKEELLNKIVDFASGKAGSSLVVFTPNPEFLVEAQKNKEFLQLLNCADLNLPDGVGLLWAGKILGQEIKERVAGADVVREVLEIGNRLSGENLEKSGDFKIGQKARRKQGEKGKGWVVGVVGARRGILFESAELVKRLQQKYPHISFVNLDDPSFLKIQYPVFNVIFACQGMKKQERWIWESKKRVPARVFMGVGGSLDFITGFSRRAPRWIRGLGLEWLWRGLQRPKHFQRIWRATVVFAWLVLKEKFRSLRKGYLNL